MQNYQMAKHFSKWLAIWTNPEPMNQSKLCRLIHLTK